MSERTADAMSIQRFLFLMSLSTVSSTIAFHLILKVDQSYLNINVYFNRAFLEKHLSVLYIWSTLSTAVHTLGLTSYLLSFCSIATSNLSILYIYIVSFVTFSVKSDDLQN